MPPIHQGIPVWEGPRRPLGYVQMTAIVAGSGLTSIPNGTRFVLMQAEAQEIRWRDDGVAPTTTVGMIITVNSILLYTGVPENMKVTAAAVGAILNVSYYA